MGNSLSSTKLALVLAIIWAAKQFKNIRRDTAGLVTNSTADKLDKMIHDTVTTEDFKLEASKLGYQMKLQAEDIYDHHGKY